jgi:hypothetical protein
MRQLHLKGVLRGYFVLTGAREYGRSELHPI